MVPINTCRFTHCLDAPLSTSIYSAVKFLVCLFLFPLEIRSDCQHLKFVFIVIVFCRLWFHRPCKADEWMLFNIGSRKHSIFSSFCSSICCFVLLKIHILSIMINQMLFLCRLKALHLIMDETLFQDKCLIEKDS